MRFRFQGDFGRPVYFSTTPLPLPHLSVATDDLKELAIQLTELDRATG